MTLLFGFAVFVLVWWLVFFASLPWGNQTQEEVGQVAPGTAPSAPVRPRIALKALAATVVSAAIWGVIMVIVADAKPNSLKYEMDEPCWVDKTKGGCHVRLHGGHHE